MLKNELYELLRNKSLFVNELHSIGKSSGFFKKVGHFQKLLRTKNILSALSFHVYIEVHLELGRQ
jgi:hypothetical protein